MILLTTAQADQVRGLSTEGHALEPRPLKDGTFALPDEVLNDPAHAKYQALLGSLVKVATPTESTWEIDPVKLDAARWDKAKV